MTALPVAHLANSVTTLATCWKIARPDGVAFGFTSHDRDLWIAGMWYRSRPGMVPSSVVANSDFASGSMEVEGVLSAGVITADDLDAGRWLGAAVEFSIVDWAAPEAGSLTLMRGRINDVVRESGDGHAFRVELIDDDVRIETTGAPLCSPSCRAQFGDRRCGVDLAGRHVLCTVESGAVDRIVVAAPVAGPERFALGRMRVISGRWAGIDRQILGVSGTTVTLGDMLDMELTAGDVIRLEEGCDKRFSTCRDRFANSVNFSGEPHVPGTDALLRYGEL